MAAPSSLNGIDSQQRAVREFAFQSKHLWCKECGGGDILPDWLIPEQEVCTICGKVDQPEFP